MFNADHVTGHLFMALTVFLLGTASPGTSNLTIVAAAIERGRSHALATATGAMSGSLAWGIAATLGVFALLQSQAWSPVFMTVFRGNYLLLLSFMAARAALSAAPTISGSDNARKTLWSAYLKGLATHAGSPNAVLIWVCVIGLALPRSAQRSDALRIVLGCGVAGASVFGAYALAFSTIDRSVIHDTTKEMPEPNRRR